MPTIKLITDRKKKEFGRLVGLGHTGMNTQRNVTDQIAKTMILNKALGKNKLFEDLKYKSKEIEIVDQRETLRYN